MLRGATMTRLWHRGVHAMARLPRLFWFGVVLLAIGSGPLLLIILAAALGLGDPDPNPIGPGLLALITFWPAIMMIGIGWKRASQRPDRY